MKIRYKLILGIAIIVIPILFVSFASNYLIEKRVEDLGYFHTPALFLIQDISTDAIEAVEESFAFIVSGNNREKDEFLKWAEDYHIKLDEFTVISKQILAQAHVHPEAEEKESLLVGRIRANHANLVEKAKVMFDELESGGSLSNKVFTDYDNAVDMLSADLDEMVRIEKLEVDESQAAAFIIIGQNKKIILGVGILCILLALISAYFLNKSISAPLSKLKSAAQGIIQDKFHQRLEVRTNDEVGELSSVFNTMASSLQYYSENLEKLVEERTDELVKANETLQVEITERKRAEEKLKRSEKLNTSITQTAADAIITINSDGIVLLWNKAAERIFGYYSSEMVNKDLSAILPDRFITGHLTSLKLLKQGGKEKFIGITRTLKAHRKDGTEFPIELSLSSWEAENKKYYTGILRDITERKKMEEELIKAQKLESIGILAGGIAHDFNNMLAAILGNVTLARMNLNAEDENLPLLKNAEEACVAAKDLSNRLLTFSIGGAPIKVLASIDKIIKESTGLALSGSNVNCKISIPDNIAFVEIDKGQIGEAIQNIIINAVQAIPNGGIVKLRAEDITIGLKEQSSLNEGRYVKLSIEDNGVGIAKEHIDKIFDPYFTTKQTGSGMGLASAYSIINKHGGDISVESELGIGTRIYIYLPASEKTILTKKEEETAISKGKEKILLMDDEQAVGLMMSKVLAKLGYEVELVYDGAQSIQSYKKAMESGQPYDAVILDLTIKDGMGGKETIKKLLEIDPNVKAIVASGYSNDPVMSDCKKYGFKNYICKPFTAKGLGRVINQVITDQSE